MFYRFESSRYVMCTLSIVGVVQKQIPTVNLHCVSPYWWTFIHNIQQLLWWAILIWSWTRKKDKSQFIEWNANAVVRSETDQNPEKTAPTVVGSVRTRARSNAVPWDRGLSRFDQKAPLEDAHAPSSGLLFEFRFENSPFPGFRAFSGRSSAGHQRPRRYPGFEDELSAELRSM